MIIATLVNPIFNHRGVTILFYFRDNPITLESVFFGLSAAVMVGSVIVWFTCYNAIMTSDKFVYIFGRFIPTISLIISVVLRFIPKYKNQISRISEAQRCVGKPTTVGKNWVERAHNGAMVLSVMLTWSLENGVDTADSMKARGYGLRRRTSYSNYRFDSRDKLFCIFLVMLIIAIWVSMITKIISVQHFPEFIVNTTGILQLVIYLLHAIVCFFPLAMNLREDVLWRALKSKI